MATSATLRKPPVLKTAEAVLSVSVERSGKSKSPVVRVLLPDGRVTEFAHRAIVIPESGTDERSQEVFALLINGNGEVCTNPDGSPALVAVPPVTLRIEEDGSKILSLEEIAARTSMSLATIRRRIADGSLPKPIQVSKRRVGLPVAAVKAWLDERR